MNAPHFDFNRIPLHPSDGGFIAAVVAEEQRVCKEIDERLLSVGKEFCMLSDKARAIAMELDTKKGFFARVLIHMRLREVTSRMSDLMDIRYELITARWRRTYGA